MPTLRVPLRRILLMLVAILGLGSSLGARPLLVAATLEVNSLADPGIDGCDATECTLREAIAAAQPGDTVTFAAALRTSGSGTITLTAGELVIDKDLTIDGPGIDGPEEALLLAMSGNLASRVFRIVAGSVVTMRRIRIMGGHADDCPLGLSEGGDIPCGGGLYNAGTLTLQNVRIRFNTADFGGGLVNAGTLTLQNVRIRFNTAAIGGGLFNQGTLTLDTSMVGDNTGGGLYNTAGTVTLHNSTVSSNAAGTVTLHNSTVSSNTADFGGGLYNDGTLTLHNSTVSSNTATIGGGLFNGLGMLTLHNSTVSGNTAINDGGGLYNDGTLTLHTSTVHGNTADFGGGGLFNQGTLTLDTSTVSGNTAGIFGGGIYSLGATLSLGESTISRNTAPGGAGGGLYSSGQAVFHNTLVAGNTAADESRADCAREVGRLISQGDNLVGAGTGCPVDSTLGDLTVDPVVVFKQVLGPLQDNGGPTWTHALLLGSPAIDAGDPEQCPATDQRGVARPQGAGCDIGAFELEAP